MSTVLKAGERVQLTSPKGRLHTITLAPGALFHTNDGAVRHDDLIGAPEGVVVRSTKGAEYLAFRPLLADFVMSMPRGAAIVYPKDAAQIISWGDIAPGMTVVEAGVGSGALSLWLLRALTSSGRLLSFERREEFASIARANAETFLGSVPANWGIHIGDLGHELSSVAEDASVDRVVLDMLAPWECVDAIVAALAPGGVLVAYVATVPQLSRLAEALRESRRFTEPESEEIIVRGWHVDRLAVRPDHRMVGHTGFLIRARLLAPGVDPLPRPRRATKDGFLQEDIDVWDSQLPEAERIPSPKRLRRIVRDAEEEAQARTRGTGD